LELLMTIAWGMAGLTDKVGGKLVTRQMGLCIRELVRSQNT